MRSSLGGCGTLWEFVADCVASLLKVRKYPCTLKRVDALTPKHHDTKAPTWRIAELEENKLGLADGMGFEPMEPCHRLDRFTVGWFKPLTNPSAMGRSGEVG